MNERPQAIELEVAEGRKTPYHGTPALDVVVFPTFLELHDCQRDGLTVGAQYAHPDDSGAHTGDVSMAMLAGINVSYVLCGHSERRQQHEESSEAIGRQVASALRNGLVPVVCIGENADQYELHETEDVLRDQLLPVLDACGKAMTRENVIVAYEPVWAIGTGKTPDPSAIEQTHAFIRSLLPKKDIRIIYGGSVTPKNAASIFAEKNVDGALVGGCSLKLEEFADIIRAAK